LEGELPPGVRPDLTVDGTIEIERLSNVLYVGRPTNAQAGATIQMFKVLPTGEAIRTNVHVGRVSVNLIEILEGVQEGDEVILSDMSLWDAYDRLRLN
jgi:HlyD family secretion protein